jgi:DNA mismatch repair protein MutL
VSDFLSTRRIALLSDALVNQIAAGEVIERPASVVKELVENAIDANATRIEIHIYNGGTDKILIRDNGTGIHPEDMPLAIARHSTSKLGSFDELMNILSMGFRGEALSSIASIADFSIISRIAAAEHGWQLDYNPRTQQRNLAPAAHPVGTTVQVDNLFQSVPARRKFLRSDRTEFLVILEVVKRLVFSRFDIAISLQHNGKQVLNCPAVEADYSVRIKPVMGSHFYNHARKLDVSSESMHLWGWLGDEQSARNQSDRQYLYLNNRVIRDRQLNHAIRLALEDIIPASRYPSYILHLHIDPVMVDVNVHPTKQEVRFRQPRDVHDFIYAVLRDNLIRTAAAVNPDQSIPTLRSSGQAGLSVQPWRGLHESRSIYSAGAYQDVDQHSETTPFGRPINVLHQRYVLALYADELRVIDYVALESHYLTTRLQQDVSANVVRQRPLLVPVTLNITDAELSLLLSNQLLLARLGLDLEQSGPQSIRVRSIPALLPDLDINAVLAEILNTLQNRQITTADLQRYLLEILIRHSCNAELEAISLAQLQQKLTLLACDLPVQQRSYRGLWQSLSSSDLQRLLDHG